MTNLSTLSLGAALLFGAGFMPAAADGNTQAVTYSSIPGVHAHAPQQAQRRTAAPVHQTTQRNRASVASQNNVRRSYSNTAPERASALQRAYSSTPTQRGYSNTRQSQGYATTRSVRARTTTGCPTGGGTYSQGNSTCRLVSNAPVQARRVVSRSAAPAPRFTIDTSGMTGGVGIGINGGYGGGGYVSTGGGFGSSSVLNHPAAAFTFGAFSSRGRGHSGGSHGGGGHPHGGGHGGGYGGGGH